MLNVLLQSYSGKAVYLPRQRFNVAVKDLADVLHVPPNSSFVFVLFQDVLEAGCKSFPLSVKCNWYHIPV